MEKYVCMHVAEFKNPNRRWNGQLEIEDDRMRVNLEDHLLEACFESCYI